MAYIDREKLLEKIKERANPTGCKLISPKDVYDTVMTVVECMETKDVAPVRHGKWETTELYMIDECSECGAEFNVDEFARSFEYVKTGFTKLKYCPNCGAKMDLGEQCTKEWKPEGDTPLKS